MKKLLCCLLSDRYRTIAYCLLPIAYCLLSIPSFSQFWSDVGGGVDSGTCAYDLHVYNNELYATGCIQYIGGVKVRGIAKWNGIKWDSVSFVDAPPVFSGDSHIICGGAYAKMETFNNELYIADYACGVKKWDGTNLNLVVRTKNYDEVTAIQYKNDLYIGGWFDSVGNTKARLIAAYNGTNWYEPGNGVYQLINLETIVDFEVYKNKLIACGGLYSVGWTPMRVNLIASWDGQKWDSLAGGMYWGQHVQSLGVDTINDFLYAAGTFMLIWNRGIPDTTYYIARWDGFRWSAVGESKNQFLIYTNAPMGLKLYHGKMYAGCGGNNPGTKDTALIAWNGKNWEVVELINAGISDLEVWKDTLYVANILDTINGIPLNYIAKYYVPWDSGFCNFLEPVIYALTDSSKWYTYSDTFYITNNDSVQVFFYNNIAHPTYWLWDFGDGDTGSGKTPAHYYNTAGTYTVSVIVNYPWGPYGPCIDTAYKVITVINNTGVNDPETSSGLRFKVYPNPAKKEITIELTGDKGQRTNEKYIVKIKNSLGQKIYEKKFEKKLVLGTSAFKQGIYLVEVCSPTPNPSPKERGTVCHTEKVVIE